MAAISCKGLDDPVYCDRTVIVALVRGALHSNDFACSLLTGYTAEYLVDLSVGVPMPGVVKSSKRRRKVAGHELVAQLHAMVTQLIKENRKLKRQVDKLSAHGSAAASSTVDRGLRTLQRRVQRALTNAPARRRRVSKNGRMKRAASRN
jgi:hypothetical protein